MTNAEKKAVLLEYQAIERRIKRLQSEKQGWLEKATAVSPSFSDMPKGGGTDKIQNAVCRIADIEQKITREINRQIDLREPGSKRRYVLYRTKSCAISCSIAT